MKNKDWVKISKENIEHTIYWVQESGDECLNCYANVADKNEIFCHEECRDEWHENNPDYEKYECNECGVYYWVIDRDTFECPNCEEINNKTIAGALSPDTGPRN